MYALCGSLCKSAELSQRRLVDLGGPSWKALRLSRYKAKLEHIESTAILARQMATFGNAITKWFVLVSVA